ncbi:MAG: copper homeostasis protein CutC [Erysipelothrix sp.]
MKYCIEVCAGSVRDCEIAQECGAHRIELNNGVHLGGLTPSIATLIKAKEVTRLPIVSMVRVRPGGFHYTPLEIETMYEDAKHLIKHGTDALVFGFLNADSSVDIETTKRFVDLCHESNVEAVFHRAFDRVDNPYSAIEALIDCKVDRILTSGLKSTAQEGLDLLGELQSKYGDKIELCLGAGVNAENAKELIERSGVTQLHGSFKGWYQDPTTKGNDVSYGYSELGDYDGVDPVKLKKMLDTVNQI